MGRSPLLSSSLFIPSSPARPEPAHTARLPLRCLPRPYEHARLACPLHPRRRPRLLPPRHLSPPIKAAACLAPLSPLRNPRLLSLFSRRHLSSSSSPLLHLPRATTKQPEEITIGEPPWRPRRGSGARLQRLLRLRRCHAWIRSGTRMFSSSSSTTGRRRLLPLLPRCLHIPIIDSLPLRRPR